MAATVRRVQHPRAVEMLAMPTLVPRIRAAGSRISYTKTRLRVRHQFQCLLPEPEPEPQDPEATR